jgi:hypothetical protein
MQGSTPSRIQRGPAPKEKIPRSKYRRVLPELMRDFVGRCAYSCQHYSRAGGVKCMEVDHFDYRRKDDVFQKYENLFLATRHCNGAKRDKPSPKERKAGLRFLNPCEEWDYGKHIFEDPLTHKLIGVTPEGIYHIRCCDLNAEHLVTERRDRAEILEILNTGGVFRNDKPLEEAAEITRALIKQVERMIPAIPFLPPKNV